MNRFVLLLFPFLLVSCNEKKDGNISDNALDLTYKSGYLNITPGNSSTSKGIIISNFTADTSSLKKTKGISTAFTIEINADYLSSIHKQEYDALMVDMTCKGASGKTFSYRNSYLPDLATKHIYPDKNIFITSRSTRDIAMHIPFRELELPVGKQIIHMNIHIYGVNFKKDTHMVETKHIARISPEPMSSTSFEASINAPVLYHTTIKISDLVICNKNKDPHKYDFAFGGNGYPDPYWQLWCGETLIYYSPELKNALKYPGPYTSSSFYLCEKDALSIRFLDYDKGPFNQDDLIESWNGDLLELKRTTQFIQGNLSSCNIEVLNP